MTAVLFTGLHTPCSTGFRGTHFCKIQEEPLVLGGPYVSAKEGNPSKSR